MSDSAIIDERKKLLHEEIDENAKIGRQIEEKKQKPGLGHERASSRRHGNDKEAEKMDVSDLEEEDTGVNVDYGVSGDEEENPAAAATADIKVVRQKKMENSSPDKRHKSSRHSRDAGHHRSRDDGRQIKHQTHRRSSKRTQRKSEERLSMSEEAPRVAQVEKEDEADKMEDDGEVTKLHDQTIEEDNALSPDRQNNGYDLNDIPCPTTATELKESPSTGDDVVIIDSGLDAQ